MKSSQKTDIEAYLKTGESSPLATNWPGDNLVEQIKGRDKTIRQALLSEVNRLVPQKKRKGSSPIANDELVAWTNRKLEPMVSGLFPKTERGPVLALLARSVVLITHESIERLILEEPWSHTAWEVANIYTRHYAGEAISENAPCIVGLSVDSTCYVSMAYFDEDEPFADFVVHEAAHFFHNVKRASAGLPTKRGREWLLPVAYRLRETFAYSCEAFSRILEKANSKSERLSLSAKLKLTFTPPDERVDRDEYYNIVEEAAESRNGWKVILKRCGVE